MYIVAVTGGLAAGKGVACDYFRSRGAVVIDLDEVARRMLSPGHEVAEKVIEAFGSEILAPDGAIDRAALACVAFSSFEKARLLNSIVHPAVAADVLPGLTEMGLLQNPPPLVCLDVPMLVEAPVFGEIADVILNIYAPEELRLSRAVERGMTRDDARARIACQATDSQREAIAHHTVRNEETIDEFTKRLSSFWDEVVEGVT